MHSKVIQFSSVQSLSHAQLFATPWTTTCQFIINSQSLLKLMSIESVMLSNHLLILCHPLLQPSIFPSIRIFPVSQFFASGGQSIGVSASASVLPMNIQGWFPLGLTGWLSDKLSNHLIWFHPLILWPSICLSIKVFPKWVGSLHQVPKYWNFSFSIRQKSHSVL